MRPIRFRGKDLIGQWRYGIPDFQPDGYCEMISRDKQGFSKAVVLPKTIGQYTGLKDKHGKEIYEGDIISSGATTGIVMYDCEQAGFIVQKEKAIELRFYSLLGIEVIGNIHDNPELLQKGGEA